jgi:hypothetical protein
MRGGDGPTSLPQRGAGVTMLERLEIRFAEQKASFAAVHSKLLAGRFADSQRRRVSRYLAAAQGVTAKPLRISIVGELNAGKTALANLILGVQLLPTSIISNTPCPTLIRYGEEHTVRHYRDDTHFEETNASELHRFVQREGFRVECALPLPLLRTIEIADLPAFENAVFSGGRMFPLLRRSDILVWCSRATKAWTASENSIWLQLPKRLKTSCLFVLTHADKLNASALKEVASRVRAEIHTIDAELTFLATPHAMAARSPRGQIMNPKLWASSGGEGFFKKLGDLLQTALGNRQSRIEKNANRILSSVLSDMSGGDNSALLCEWMTLETLFTVNGETSGEQVANTAIEAVARFKRDVFGPWLRLHNCPDAEMEALLKLLPDRAAELSAGSRHRLPERLPLIFQQLAAEIEECRSISS